jgi:hypothetical protein
MMKLKLILAAFVFALAARAAVYDQITAVVGTTTQKVNVVVGSGSITNISGVRYLILDNSGNGGGGTWTAGGTITGNLTIAGALTINGATTNNTTVNQITTINLGTNYVETVSYTTNYTAQTFIVSTNTVTTNSVAQIVTIGGFIEAHQGSHVYTPHLYDTATGSLVASGSVDWTGATWVNPPTNGWTFGSANAVTNASGPGVSLANGVVTFSTNEFVFGETGFSAWTNAVTTRNLFTNRVDAISGGGTWAFATNTWTFTPATDTSRAAAATQIGISLNGTTNYVTLSGGVIELGELAAVTGSVTHALTADSADTATTATTANSVTGAVFATSGNVLTNSDTRLNPCSFVQSSTVAGAVIDCDFSQGATATNGWFWVNNGIGVTVTVTNGLGLFTMLTGQNVNQSSWFCYPAGSWSNVAATIEVTLINWPQNGNNSSGVQPTFLVGGLHDTNSYIRGHTFTPQGASGGVNIIGVSTAISPGASVFSWAFLTNSTLTTINLTPAPGDLKLRFGNNFGDALPLQWVSYSVGTPPFFTTWQAGTNGSSYIAAPFKYWGIAFRDRGQGGQFAVRRITVWTNNLYTVRY